MRRLRLAPLKYGFSSEEDAGFLSDKFMAQDPFKELLNDLQEFRIVEVISQKELAKRFPLTYEELEEETGIPNYRLKYAIILKNKDEQGFHGVIYFVYSA